MAVSKEEIVDAIAKLSVLDVVELISDLEKKFGVTAAAPVAVAAVAAAGAPAAAVEEQTEFSITLTEYPADKKVTVIKVVREITGLGQGSQGPGRGRARSRQGFRGQGRCRWHQEEAGRCRRQGRSQVTTWVVAGSARAQIAPRHRLMPEVVVAVRASFVY
jgi:ribosomal protein L7/L12